MQKGPWRQTLVPGVSARHLSRDAQQHYKDGAKADDVHKKWCNDAVMAYTQHLQHYLGRAPHCLTLDGLELRTTANWAACGIPLTHVDAVSRSVEFRSATSACTLASGELSEWLAGDRPHGKKYDVWWGDFCGAYGAESRRCFELMLQRGWLPDVGVMACTFCYRKGSESAKGIPKRALYTTIDDMCELAKQYGYQLKAEQRYSYSNMYFVIWKYYHHVRSMRNAHRYAKGAPEPAIWVSRSVVLSPTPLELAKLDRPVDKLAHQLVLHATTSTKKQRRRQPLRTGGSKLVF